MFAQAAMRCSTTAHAIFRASFADPHVTRTTILSVISKFYVSLLVRRASF